MDTTGPERAARRRERRAHAIEAYVLLYGRPGCSCGCGAFVRFDRDGKPSRFVLGHTSPGFDAANQARLAGNLPVEDFRRALFKLKEAKGWTIADLAEAAKCSQSSMQGLLYAKRRKTVSREWATDFFRRIAGMPTAPTPWQHRFYGESNLPRKRRQVK